MNRLYRVVVRRRWPRRLEQYPSRLSHTGSIGLDIALIYQWVEQLYPLGGIAESDSNWSYVRKLVTELSGGVFGYLDSVLERHSFDEFGELI